MLKIDKAETPLGHARKAVIGFLDDLPAGGKIQLLGDYQVHGRLAVPGKEQAYEAVDAADGHVVLKCYPVAALEQLGDPTEFLRRETKALNKLADTGRAWQALPFFRDEAHGLFVVPSSRPPQARQPGHESGRPDPERPEGVCPTTSHATSSLTPTPRSPRCTQRDSSTAPCTRPGLAGPGRERPVQRLPPGPDRPRAMIVAVGARRRPQQRLPRARVRSRALATATPVGRLLPDAVPDRVAARTSRPRADDRGDAGETALKPTPGPTRWRALTRCRSTGPAPRSWRSVSRRSPVVTWWPQQATDEFRSGGVVDGRYRIEGMLGYGGFALTWQVFDDRRAPQGAQAFQQALPEALREEYLAAHQLNHDRCGRVYDIQIDQSPHYLVSEYVDGKLAGGARPLADRSLRRSPSMCSMALGLHPRQGPSARRRHPGQHRRRQRRHGLRSSSTSASLSPAASGRRAGLPGSPPLR